MVLRLPTDVIVWTTNEYVTVSLQDSSSHGLGYSFFKERILVLTRGLCAKCGRKHLMAYLFRVFGIPCHVMLMNSCNATYILQITTSNNQKIVRGMIRCSKLGIHWISLPRDCAKYGHQGNTLQLTNQ